MGKPFENELAIINQTFVWAKQVPLNFSEEDERDLLSAPTFVVGSGGSSSACHLFSMLQHSKGGFCKAVTPFELHYISESIRKSNAVFISASGKNNDILLAYKNAIQNDAERVFGLCMKKKTKLGSLASSHSVSKIIELECPAGKDGFLATNSLIANFTILSRMFKHSLEIEELQMEKTDKIAISQFVKNLAEDFTITVLYAGWSQPIAIDIESKFTEAGLGNIHFADFRNFAHGRHNWLDKKRKQSAILALVTPKEKALAEKTLSLLPTNIPKLILSTTCTEASAAIHLLYKSFYFVAEVGKKLGIDPGKPGVPAYGSKLYNLPYQSLVRIQPKIIKNAKALLGKAGKKNIAHIEKSELRYWETALGEFRKKINKGKFGSLIFDYDGTLCSREEKKTRPRDAIVNQLNSFLGKGFILGIVTGRGKSVRQTLQDCIDPNYWDNVIIGYYNGAEISSLKDNSVPNASGDPNSELKMIADELNKIIYPSCPPSITLRPFQLTIENNNSSSWPYIKQRVIECVKILNDLTPVIVESAHSIDVLSSNAVSKLNIVRACIHQCKANKLETGYICIGDKGKYPGNDFALLTSAHSLSVDEVSSDPSTCWDLSDVGCRGVSSSLKYFQAINYKKSFFTFSL